MSEQKLGKGRTYGHGSVCAASTAWAGQVGSRSPRLDARLESHNIKRGLTDPGRDEVRVAPLAKPRQSRIVLDQPSVVETKTRRAGSSEDCFSLLCSPLHRTKPRGGRVWILHRAIFCPTQARKHNRRWGETRGTPPYQPRAVSATRIFVEALHTHEPKQRSGSVPSQDATALCHV